jgi:acyl-CoA:6-aminopenicillanic acid acyl transferase
MHTPPFTFRSIRELELGPTWQRMFEERWPHYREWFLQEGDAARPSYATSVRMLRAHMPELMPAYERVVELAGAGDLAARMLSSYRPPPYLAACSQGCWTRQGGPMLVRNYDYAPSRFEGTVWLTRMLEQRVIGMSDCLWGLLDGVNESGLAVSLTFGGRRVLGDGFGIPIVVRYVLEVCETVADARSVLARLPYSLSHNLTVADRQGDVLTAYLSPDCEPIFRVFPVATNHQGIVEWPSRRMPPGRSSESAGSFTCSTKRVQRRRRSSTRFCDLRYSARRTRAGSARSTRPRIFLSKGAPSTAGRPARGGSRSTTSPSSSTPRSSLKGRWPDSWD